VRSQQCLFSTALGGLEGLDKQQYIVSVSLKAAEMDGMTETCFNFLLILWSMVCSFIDMAIITFWAISKSVSHRGIITFSGISGVFMGEWNRNFAIGFILMRQTQQLVLKRLIQEPSWLAIGGDIGNWARLQSCLLRDSR
jgi:hypothetical protein